METIKAFGTMVDRNKAMEIIINDKVAEFCGLGCEDALRELLVNGWTPLDEWTDEELEDHIDGLCVENQPDCDAYEIDSGAGLTLTGDEARSADHAVKE